VSMPEPFQRLVNQGYILAPAYVDERGVYVEASEVEERDGEYFFSGEPVRRESGKMGKSLKNAVGPEDIYRDYGADTLRLYEMFMGPLEASRPWNTADIVGVFRFLQRLWRNVVDEESGGLRVSDAPADDDMRRMLHRTIAAVGADMADMGFNTAIARLFELNNHVTTVVQRDGAAPRDVIEPLVLMVAPLAPHIGHDGTLAYEKFPVADSSWLTVDSVEVPVQVNGKVRSRVTVPVGADEFEHERLARADMRISALLDNGNVRKVVVVPGRTVNFVLA